MVVVVVYLFIQSRLVGDRMQQVEFLLIIRSCFIHMLVSVFEQHPFNKVFIVPIG